jgi:AcrR family transcriptional regulator
MTVNEKRQATGDPRPRRHEAKRAAIVDAAWELAAEEGLAGMTMRALATRVGLRQPSLYAYFDSKLGIYDAMFADANERQWALLQSLDLPGDPRAAVKVVARALVEFSTQNPVMAELMFSRTVPGFEPSEAAFARAIEFDAWARKLFAAAGLTRRHQQDGFVVILNGLANVQNANEPGGSRWKAQLDWMLDMYFREVDRQRRQRQ